MKTSVTSFPHRQGAHFVHLPEKHASQMQDPQCSTDCRTKTLGDYTLSTSDSCVMGYGTFDDAGDVGLSAG